MLAYAMIDRTLPMPTGVPLRLRPGRQLGCKTAKYLRRIEPVDSPRRIEDGHGGFDADNRYEWYLEIWPERYGDRSGKLRGL